MKVCLKNIKGTVRVKVIGNRTGERGGGGEIVQGLKNSGDALGFHSKGERSHWEPFDREKLTY